MNNDLTPSIVRASRIVGLGLLALTFFTRTGTPTEARYFGYIGLAFVLWCLIEIVRSYFQRPS